METPPASKAPGSTTSVSIRNPASDGDTFDGTAGGQFSPDGSSITCDFWRADPTGQSPEPAPDAVGTVGLGELTWSASFNMSGVAATTTGFLRATNDNGGTDERKNLQWTPPV